MIDALTSVATRQPWLWMLPGIWIGSRSQLVRSSWLVVDIHRSREGPFGGLKNRIGGGYDAFEFDGRLPFEDDQKIPPAVGRARLQREVACPVIFIEPDRLCPPEQDFGAERRTFEHIECAK